MAAGRGFVPHLLLFTLLAPVRSGAASEPAWRGAQEREPLDSPLDKLADITSSARDMVTRHMLKLYERYDREANRPRNGNTVRSFKARPETEDQRVAHHLNLTSLQGSEVILTATFHFLLERRPRQRPWFCRRFKNPDCRVQSPHRLPPIRLLVRTSSRPGLSLGQVTLSPHRRGVWLSSDVTALVKEARSRAELLIQVEVEYGDAYQRGPDPISSSGLPYLLVYADDQAVAQPNSVASSLQRHDPHDPHDPHDLTPTAREPSAAPPDGAPEPTRVRRDAFYYPDPILSNELPEAEDDGVPRQETWKRAHAPPTPKNARREKERRKKGRDERMEGWREVEMERWSQSALLSFDEKTMRRARRRQGQEPQGCSRRHLRVDFADIGWSEWVMSPKAFDAFFCAGACGFPLPKLVRPSNHATIQSIVKAVGIIPGIPEPCCVPDKMNALAVLFLDEGRNVVLKVYPNMAVESCVCR